MAGEEFFAISRRPMTDAEATCRNIFLDFDRNQTRPRPGRAYPLQQVSEATLNAESIERILSSLNDYFAAQRVSFTATEPEDEDYQTIYVNEVADEPTPDPDKVINIGAVREDVNPGERRLIESIAVATDEILKKPAR